MPGFRTSARLSPNLYTNSSGSGGTAVVVSLTGTTVSHIFLTGVQVSHHTAAGGDAANQKVEVRQGSTILFRTFVGTTRAVNTQFYSPILIPAPNSASATISISAAGQTADVTLLYYMEPV